MMELRERVEEILEEQIRPFLAMHGGGVELVDMNEEEGKIFLKLSGGCQGCSSSQATLKDGIENLLRSEIDEIQEIIDLTDHSQGDTPYFK